MEIPKLRDIPLTVKLFISLLLCLVSLSYLMLLSGIWIDTEMKVANIIEGYGDFEFIELTEHSFKYLFWFIGAFGVTVSLFLMSSWPEKMKRFFAVAVPILIISDLGSMWLIRYSDFFAWQLYVSGALLAASFFVMFLTIQLDLWVNGALRKKRRMVSKIGAVSEEILKVVDDADEAVNVKEIEYHLKHSADMIHMSLSWLVREGVICAEARNGETLMIRSNSPAHDQRHCQGTHQWVKR